MNVAICDDDKAYADILESAVRRCAPKADIYVFSDGRILLNENIKWNVVFLDIEMDGMNGFEIAKSIRRRYSENECIISFVTTHSELAADGYDYKAFRYILKDAPESIRLRKVRETVREYYSKNKFLKISYKGAQRKLPVHEIRCIEVVGHCLNIKTDSESVCWNNTINQIETELSGYGFIRCHRSFIVSYDSIKEIRAKDILLKNGDIVPIGRAYKKHFEENFLSFKSL